VCVCERETIYCSSPFSCNDRLMQFCVGFPSSISLPLLPLFGMTSLEGIPFFGTRRNLSIVFYHTA
jgi:hypothetical protein